MSHSTCVLLLLKVMGTDDDFVRWNSPKWLQNATNTVK